MKHHYDTDPAIEPSHYPHMHRLWMGDRPTPVHLAVATQRDGTVRYLPTKPAPLLAEIDRSDAAEEGGTFREPASAAPRVPRVQRPHVNDEGPQNVPASWRETAMVLGVPLAILLVALGVWAWRTFA